MKWLRGLESQKLSQKSRIREPNRGAWYICHGATASLCTQRELPILKISVQHTAFFGLSSLKIECSFLPVSQQLWIFWCFFMKLKCKNIYILYKYIYVFTFPVKWYFSFLMETLPCHTLQRSLTTELCIWRLASYFQQYQIIRDYNCFLQSLLLLNSHNTSLTAMLTVYSYRGTLYASPVGFWPAFLHIISYLNPICRVTMIFHGSGM